MRHRSNQQVRRLLLLFTLHRVICKSYWCLLINTMRTSYLCGIGFVSLFLFVHILHVTLPASDNSVDETTLAREAQVQLLVAMLHRPEVCGDCRAYSTEGYVCCLRVDGTAIACYDRMRLILSPSYRCVPVQESRCRGTHEWVPDDTRFAYAPVPHQTSVRHAEVFTLAPNREVGHCIQWLMRSLRIAAPRCCTQGDRYPWSTAEEIDPEPVLPSQNSSV